MRPRNQRQPVIMIERLADILTERVSCTTGTDAPTASVVGVGPEQVAHGAFVGYFLDPVDGADVV